MKKVFFLILLCALGARAAFAADAFPRPAEVKQPRWFTQASDAEGSRTPYGLNDATARWVQAGDAKIYYEVYGQGKPLFVFHGGGVGSPYEMGRMIDLLRERFQVVVVSTRGHGRSEIGHTPLSFELKAADMLAVMRAVTDQPAAVLGFSDGAYTAYKVAVAAPQSVERIAAIGAGTLKAGSFPPDMSVAELEKFDAAYIAQLRALMPEPERLQEFMTANMKFWNAASVGEETFSAIACPVLFIAGDEDDHAPVRTVLEAYELTPNARLCIVPKAWHTCFIDNFPVAWAAIKQFLTAPLEKLTPSRKVAARK